MLALPMAVPFVAVLAAAIAAALGLRRTAMLVWLIAAAIMAYAFVGHLTDPLKIAL
jgi:hypothetical protein